MLLFFLLLGRWVKEKCARSRTKGPGSRRGAWWTSWTNTDAGTGAFVTLRRAFTLFDWIRKAYVEFSTRLTRYFKSTKLQGDWNVFLFLLKSYENPVPPRFAGKKCVQRETLANAMALKKFGITYCSGENCTKNMCSIGKISAAGCIVKRWTVNVFSIEFSLTSILAF